MRLTVALAGTTVSMVLATAAIHAAKPQPEPKCSVQFGDAAGDVVRSDGAGPYVNGVAGVDCHIIEPSGWLVLQFAAPTRKSPGSSRSIVYVGQSNGVASLGAPAGTASYTTFAEAWLQGSVAAGRPADVLVMPDGSLLVSDDKAGRIYRITYAPGA